MNDKVEIVHPVRAEVNPITITEATLLSRVQFDQIKAAVEGMADYHSNDGTYSKGGWVKRDDLLKFIETFAMPKPPKVVKTRNPKVVSKPLRPSSKATQL